MQAWQDNMLASSRYSAHEDVPACKIQKCLHIQGHSLLHNPTKYKAQMGLATASQKLHTFLTLNTMSAILEGKLPAKLYSAHQSLYYSRH